MNTALRAAADRLIYDVAALRTVAGSIEDPEFTAICPATGLSVAATFAQLVEGYRAAAASLVALAGSAPAIPEGWPGTSAATPPGHVDPDDVDELLATALCDIIDALAALPPASATPPVVEVVTAWSAIGANHALDFIEAVPALAFDPLLFNWAVFPTPGEPAGLHERRAAAIKRARAARKKAR